MKPKPGRLRWTQRLLATPSLRKRSFMAIWPSMSFIQSWAGDFLWILNLCFVEIRGHSMQWTLNMCHDLKMFVQWSDPLRFITFVIFMAGILWNYITVITINNVKIHQVGRDRKNNMNLGLGFWGCELSVVWRFSMVFLTEVSFSSADSAKTYVCENFNFSVILDIMFWPQLSLLHCSPFQTVRSQWWQSHTRSWFKICLWVRFDLVRTNRI